MRTSGVVKSLLWTLAASFAILPSLIAGQDSQPKEVEKVSDGIVPPRAIFMPNPPYTPEARQKGISGEVSLKVEVRPDGTTDNIRVVKSLDSSLDQSAVDTVAHWRFQPATKAGVPVSKEIVIVTPFSRPDVGGFPVANPGPGVYSGLPCAAKIDTRDIKDLQKKANKGDPKSQFMMGCACEFGVAMAAPDRHQAIDWYRRAAESLVPAQYFLGETYLSNYDYVNAYVWLSIASAGGYKDPHDNLKTVTQLLTEEQRSDAQQQVAAWKQQHRTN